MSDTRAPSFRGLYAVLYRNYGGVAHPTFRGLNVVVDEIDLTHRRVRLEGRYENNGPYGIATVILTLALWIAAEAVGWPRTDQLDAIFAAEDIAPDEVAPD